MTTLTLTAQVVRARPFAEYERDAAGLPVTADVVFTLTFEFADAADLTSYLVGTKGLSAERAERVIARKCQFNIEPAEGMLSTRYRVS